MLSSNPVNCSQIRVNCNQNEALIGDIKVPHAASLVKRTQLAQQLLEQQALVHIKLGRKYIQDSLSSTTHGTLRSHSERNDMVISPVWLRAHRETEEIAEAH